jgi:TldD protein
VVGVGGELGWPSGHGDYDTPVPGPALIDPPVLERVLAAALARGGDLAEVFAEDRVTTGAVLDDQRIEELSSGRDRGAGIRVIVGETTGFAHTADLSEPGLRAAAEAASAVAREGGGGVRTVALDAARAAGRRAPEASVLPETVAKGRKLELLQRADEAARAAGGSVTQVQAGYGDSRRRILVANSDGVLAHDDQVRTRFNVAVVATGDTGMQTGYESVARTEGFEVFDREDVDELARTAAGRALAKLSAWPAPSGEVPVVLAGGSGGILFHEACGHGLEADHIVKDASVYVGRVGELVASPLVTLVDDGTVGGEWGNFAVDDEGRPAARNVLIENGVLTDYLWDWLRARQEGRASSGNGRRQSYQYLPMVRMTNTFLLAGEADPDEVVAQTPHGVYVAKLGGGQVNTATGDFVFGTTEAYLIEDGKLTAPLRDANLIGNGPEVLRRIDVVATDFDMTPGTCGKDGQSVPVGCGQPTLRITGVTIGGTAA